MASDYFFDTYRLAEFYDDLYGWIDEDIPFWRHVTSGAQSILELASGSGRVTLPLAESGSHITALDYSRDMLDILKRRLASAPPGVSGRVRVINSDMRHFDTGDTYDAIIITSNSLNHIETNADLSSTFNAIERHIKPGGVVAFDILNPDPRYLQREMGTQYDRRVITRAGTGEHFLHWETSSYDKASQINHVRYFFRFCTSMGVELDDKLQTVDVRVRLFFPQEIDSFLEARGYRQVVRFDDYVGGKWSGRTARQIFLVRT